MTTSRLSDTIDTVRTKSWETDVEASDTIWAAMLKIEDKEGISGVFQNFSTILTREYRLSS